MACWWGMPANKYFCKVSRIQTVYFLKITLGKISIVLDKNRNIWPNQLTMKWSQCPLFQLTFHVFLMLGGNIDIIFMFYFITLKFKVLCHWFHRCSWNIKINHFCFKILYVLLSDSLALFMRLLSVVQLMMF